MKRPYFALFYGAGPTVIWPLGGWLTSMGITKLASDLRFIGCEADCFTFNEFDPALAKLRAARKVVRPTGGVGYSLGNTPLLQLQKFIDFDLVFSVACSSWAGKNNADIDKRHTKRSVLWRGPGSFSNYTPKGFDEINDVEKPHLLMDLDSKVSLSALTEAKRLING